VRISQRTAKLAMGKDDKSGRRRGPGRPFEPGKSGNPAGRPPKQRRRTTKGKWQPGESGNPKGRVPAVKIFSNLATEARKFASTALETVVELMGASTTESQRRYLIEITWFFKNAPFSKNPTISITSSNCRHSSTSHPANIRLAAAREVLDRGFGRSQVSVDLKADVATTSLKLFADISPADQRLASEALGAIANNPSG
jgi:hypothetical protein